mgnify:CR=1 FL=1
MVSKKTLVTMKWWYDTERKPASYFNDLVIDEKITQEECNYILGIGT